MIKNLIELGVSENTILSMVELNPQIKDIGEIELKNKIEILKNINCSNTQIIDIITSNANFFNTIDDDNIKLINYLSELGFNCLNILFDSNPYILNLEVYEIKNYINNLLKKDLKLEDIVDELSNNTLLFNEM